MSSKTALILAIVIIVLGAIGSILHLFKRTQSLGDRVEELAAALGKLTGVALVFVFSLSLVACSQTQKTALKAIGSCAATAAASEVSPLAKFVLDRGDATWRNELTGLAIGFGEDAIACAVQDVARVTEMMAAAAADVPTAQDRARTWLNENGYTP